MRSIVTRVGLLATAFIALAAGSAQASTLEVKVPFPFVVHGRTMPAGQYRLTDDGGIVELQGKQGQHADVFVLSTPASGQDPKGDAPALTFQRRDNQYWLTTVWESASHGLAMKTRT